MCVYSTLTGPKSALRTTRFSWNSSLESVQEHQRSKSRLPGKERHRARLEAAGDEKEAKPTLPPGPHPAEDKPGSEFSELY